VKITSTSLLLKNCIKITKNNQKYINLIDLIKIALLKKIDYYEISFFSIYQNVLGTLNSMSLKIN